MSGRLFLVQRLTAALLAPLVLLHLAIVLYAVHDGLSAAEILGRTRGSLGWMLLYGGFVVLIAIHGPIGLRAVIHETCGLRGRGLDLALALLALLLLALGLRAVAAVTLP